MRRGRVALIAVLLTLLGAGAIVWSRPDADLRLDDQHETAAASIPDVTDEKTTAAPRVQLPIAEPRRARRRVEPPETQAARRARSHFDLLGRGGRGRIVDEDGQPIADVDVRFFEIHIVPDDENARATQPIPAWREDLERGRGGGAGGMSRGHGRTAYLAQRTVQTDADGWFECAGTQLHDSGGDRRLVVVALIPGRRPFRATEPLGWSAREREFVAPVRAPGRRIALLRNGEPLAHCSVRIIDHTHDAQIAHGTVATDRDGTISADWFEEGRAYGLHSERSRSGSGFRGVVVWKGEAEIETTEVLRTWASTTLR